MHMHQSIHIVTNTDTESELDSVTYMTPSEAEGELVCFEPPGSMGEEVYRITNVDADAEETTLINSHTGSEYVAGDGVLPSNWNNFTTPRLGFTYTVSWKEHMNGRGEWVKVTPETGRGKYPPFYDGHEPTRTVNKTYTYTPPGIKEIEIKEYEGEPHIFVDKDISGTDAVFNQIKPNTPEYEVLGHVYVNSDWEIVYYNIKTDYRTENYTPSVRQTTKKTTH